jgi:hypothetical protein
LYTEGIVVGALMMIGAFAQGWLRERTVVMTPWCNRKTIPVICSSSTLMLGFVFAAAPTSQVAAPPPQSEVKTPTDPLLALNDASRAAYRRAKEAALARTGPVIFVEGDNLVLKHGDLRTEARFTPDVYHALKSVSHIPLALDVMLTSVHDGDRVGDDLLDDLRRYRGLIVGARERVETLRLGPGQAQRQTEIILASLRFIDSLFKSRTCEQGARTAFVHRMAPLVMANAAEAARGDLDGLHRLVSRWRDQMPAGEWNRLTVIVMGRALPRKGNLAVQYFSRLLGETGEGRRVVYAESLFDEPKALDLLASHLVDTQVGLDFFDDPTRLHRDLLGDVAKEYLDHLFDKSRGAAGDRDR